MTEIDELFHEFRAGISDPPPDAARKVALRAVGQDPAQAPVGVRLRRGLRRSGRWALAGAGAMGAAALVAVIAFLIVAAPEKKNEGTAGVAGWGLEATVVVTPDATGPDLETATRRALEIFIARGKASGIRGLEASERGPGRVKLVVPVAQRDAQIEEILRPADMRVYDLERDLIAASGDIRGLLPYLQAGSSKSSESLLINSEGRLMNWARTRAELLAPHQGKLPRGARIVGIPSGQQFTYVDTRKWPARVAVEPGDLAYALLRDAPIINSDAVKGAEKRGADLVVRVAPGAAGNLQAGGRYVALSTSEGLPLNAGVIRPSEDDDRYTVALADRRPDLWSGHLIAGGVAATFTVESRRTYGEAPGRTGDAVTSIPKIIRDTAGTALPGRPTDQGPRLEDLLRVIQARSGAHTRTIYTAPTAEGGETMWVLSEGEGASMNSGGCDLRPNLPQLTWCGWGGHGPPGSPREYYGRVAAGVTAVEARTAKGPPVAGAVANGWFLILVPRNQKKALVVIAKNEAGVEIARTTGPNLPPG
jgi:hypothetical protein